MRGEVQIVLDKPRVIKFNLWALAEAEKELNAPISELLNTKLQLNAVLTLLWCGLRSDDKKLTREKVGLLVTPDKLQGVLESVTKALTESFGDLGDEGNDQEGKGEEAATGEKPKN